MQEGSTSSQMRQGLPGQPAMNMLCMCPETFSSYTFSSYNWGINMGVGMCSVDAGPHKKKSAHMRMCSLHCAAVEAMSPRIRSVFGYMYTCGPWHARLAISVLLAVGSLHGRSLQTWGVLESTTTHKKELCHTWRIISPLWLYMPVA